ncbi:phage virion morphogenesis protein [Bosea eneae]|uniref:Phage virion morphogenesis protein n=1 Tax=Bosea eneae TaxID=151454 RepID=A0ABW0J1M3_9HYPH
MSGFSVTFSFDWDPARAAFGRLERVVADPTPITRAIGTGLVTSTQDRFDDEVAPDGSAWSPLNPLYASGKRGPGILRESGMRGGLQGSITYRAGRADVQVGSNKIYAGVHQGGAVITAKNGPFLVFSMGGKTVKTPSVTIPARPFVGISSDDQVMILDVIEGGLARALGSGPSSGGKR